MVGISGSLVSMSYAHESLASMFAGQLGERSRDAGLRALQRWVRRVDRSLGPASSERAVLDIAFLPLLDLLGYEVDRAARRHGVGFVLHLGHLGAPVAVALALPWGASIEAAWGEAVRTGIDADVRWTLAGNGSHLCLFDAARTWSRRMLSIDLRAASRNEQSARLVWALARAEALARTSTGDSLVGLVAAASDRHASRVCASLGHGVLEALGALLEGLDKATGFRFRRPLRDDETRFHFDQALTIVYRVLFLLFAEARGLVPTWHRVYSEAYTIDSLCRRLAERPQPTGLWEALQAIARLLHEGCRAGDLEVTPFNGRLFAPAHAPLADRVRMPDRVAGQALLALSTAPAEAEGAGGARGGRRRIAYADLGVEQLGAVYERVLEYEAVRSTGGLQLSRTSHTRKATGSFYTPRSLTDFLVRRTLAPLVSGKSASGILSLRIVDPAMGSGAFLVAACRYLAEAIERALVDEGTWRARDVSDRDRAGIRRQVAERCIYGVDINPTAVQVARLSLWLHTLAAERPLSFVDHHLAVGDSLVGARLIDLMRPFGRSRRTAAPGAMLDLFDQHATPALASAIPERFRLALEASDTLGAVREKERRLQALESSTGPLARWKAVADLWCAAWLRADERLSAQIVAELTAHLLVGGSSLPMRQIELLVGAITRFARERALFHWDLAFPEVFFDHTGARRADAGFDAVIGNPPWDMVRADTGEADIRARARRPTMALVRFLRDAGVYTLSGAGHPNQYQLFLERSWQLVRPGGRFGLVLPAGLAADHGSAQLRRALLMQTTLDPLLGFDNRRAIFPIHRSTRFLLVSGTNAGETRHLRGRFGIDEVSCLDRLADHPAEDPAPAYPIQVDRALLERWDPHALTIPELDDPRDVAIVSGIAGRVPALGDATGWHARFGRELNATDDRADFVPRAVSSGDLLPIVEGKHLEPFRISLDAVQLAVPRRRARERIDPGISYDRERLAYRDVAGRTNRLTVIAALLPAGTISTHTIFCLKSPLDSASARVLLALMNSLVVNYLARLRVSTHVTTAIVHNLPVPRPSHESTAAQRLDALAERLQMSGIDGDVEAYADLNAIAAGLYGLTADEYAHIVGTFPLLPEETRSRCVATYMNTATRTNTATEIQRHREHN